MREYPVTLRLDGRPCVVIGGGPLAERKARALLSAGGRVTLISPELTPPLSALAEAGEVVHHPRGYRYGDLRGIFLAIAATDDAAVQRDVAQEAEASHVLLNVVDVPSLCSFVLPAVAERGRLKVAVSSGGASPGLARRLCDELAATIGSEHEQLVEILGRLRERLRPSPQRQRIFSEIVRSPAIGWLRDRRYDEVDRLLATLVGEGWSLASLGFERCGSGPEDGKGNGS